MTSSVHVQLFDTLRRVRDVPRRRLLQLVALAVALAVLLHLAYSSTSFATAASSGFANAYTRTGQDLQTTPAMQRGHNELSLDEIRAIVSRTKGFYARDYSLNLGWNNMKYILEAAIIQASLLNRTAILPSFVYARACELPNAACAMFLNMVNRGDALNSDEWRKLPEEQQMAWQVPLELMIDLPKLRRHRNVILVSEYLRLHGLLPHLEASTGRWLPTTYHQGPNAPSLFIIKNNEIDDGPGVVLVDSYPDTFKTHQPKTPLALELEKVAGTDRQLDWVTVRRIVGDLKTNEEIERELVANGWHTLYTFYSMVPQELFKAPVYPIEEAASQARLRGLAEYYAGVKEDVILLAGETHLYRKPGGLRFMSESARQDFARLVFHELVYRDQVKELAAVLERRMRDRVGGRMFFAAHMRRGDFARLHWSLGDGLDTHLKRLKDKFFNGRRFLSNVKHTKLGPYVMAEVELDDNILSREPPVLGDPYFLMTDERSDEGMAYLRKQGAILVQDLLLPEDRQNFGWPIIYTDILALVEQSLAARSDFFVGQAFSSVAAGVIALRAVRGADPQTAVLI